MELPQITLDQIQERCTEQSCTRGVDYFYDDAISNPVFHDWRMCSCCLRCICNPARLKITVGSLDPKARNSDSYTLFLHSSKWIVEDKSSLQGIQLW